MKPLYWMVFLCVVTLGVTAIENKKPAVQKSIKELGDEIRDKRNLEYSINLPHSRVASFRSLERRISNTPLYEGPPKPLGVLYQGRPTYGLNKKSRPSLPAPSYAVQMEPMVQYSQKDPLYDGTSDIVEEVINRNEIHAQPKILTIKESGDIISENNIAENIYAASHPGQIISHGPPYGPVLLPYYEHPEPIIEIIIKESNESLPAPPVAAPLVRPRQKEPVQVFYVKYQKNPHGDGKDVIYDQPVPAITPPSNDEPDHHHDEYTTVAPELLTIAPPPSTTLRAIIKPDSEDYHSDSGIRITFGTEHHGHGHNYRDSTHEGHEESAPHISVALPQQGPPKPVNHPPPQFLKRQQVVTRDQQSFQTQNYQSNINYQENRHQHAQQRIQYQQQPFAQNYQQLPLVNSPNHQFRSQPNQFTRPTSAVFSNPSLVPQSVAPHPPLNVPQGPPRGPPPPTFAIPQGPPHRPPPNFPSQGPPNVRQPPPFSQRPEFPPSGPNSHRSSFPPGPQRPFHQGPPTQVFNEPEYLQQNYHTITTEQLDQPQQNIFREQQLPNKPPQNFRETPRKPIQAPIPLSQEEYNQRYYEQVRILQQQDRVRQRPVQNQIPQSQPVPKFPHQQPISQSLKPNTVLINHSQPQKPSHPPIDHNQIIVPQQFQQPQHLRPQPPLPQQPPQFQQEHPGSQFIPPGGELIASIPKYEQHLLIQPEPQPQQQVQQSQLIHQNFAQASPLIQERPQQPQQQFTQNQQQFIQNQQHVVQNQQQQQIVQNQQNQQFSIDVRQPQIPSTSELLSAYEQNQQEIVELQERLRKSENEQKQLLALSKDRPSPSQKTNEQQYIVKNQQNFQDVQGRNPQNNQYTSHITNKPPLISSTSRPKSVSTSRFVSSTPNSITDKPAEQKKEKTKKPVEFELPDEVPDELRQQLLSSGILENAQISVLDYDKVGDIPLESLPPEQLANFYSSGGGLQISGSSPVASVVKPNGEKVKTVKKDEDVEEASSNRSENFVDVNGKKKEVEMKVVHFDPSTVKGQQVAGKYVQDGAKRVDPVSLNDNKYNRYLPLKVNGAHFPLPDVPELKGRKVTSVVVLAPVDYDLAKGDKDGGRSERAAPNKSKGISFVAGDALKRLVKTPTVENYKKWLEKEKTTSPDLQSVVLLVTGTDDGSEKDKEIFMYDVSTQTVSKLSGELSSTFVEVAETNANSKDFDKIAVADSGTVESTVKVAPETSNSKVNQKQLPKDHKYVNHKSTYTEVDPKKQIVPEKKENRVIKTDSLKSHEQHSSESSKGAFDPLIAEESVDKPVNHVLISSGYSRMKLGRNLRRDE